MRETATRPLSWRIVISRQVNNAIVRMGKITGSDLGGFLAEVMYTRILANRDNLGRMPADKYTLKGTLFPMSDLVGPEIIEQARNVLADEGLIIIYKVHGVEYLLLPKVGKHSRIIGNMSKVSQCPDPDESVIQDWEKRFADVYTPCTGRLNGVDTLFEQDQEDVHTPYKRRSHNVRTEREGEGEVEREVETEGEERAVKTARSPKGRSKKGSKTDLTPAQQIVEKFSGLYREFSGHPYNHTNKDFVLISKLLAKYGEDEVVSKIAILFQRCKEGKEWFASGGPSDFTIGKLQSAWNYLLPVKKLSRKEQEDEQVKAGLRKERARG